MGIPSESRDMPATLRKGLLIPSPAEERKMLRTKKCTEEGVREGFKAALIGCVAIAVPTLLFVRKFAWAKASINHTGQALIISAGSIASFFISADKSTSKCAKKNSLLEDALRRQSQS